MNGCSASCAAVARFFGSRSRQRAAKSCASGGNDGGNSGTFPLCIRWIMRNSIDWLSEFGSTAPSSFSSTHGSFPVAQLISVSPSDHTSDSKPYSPSSSRSGAMKSCVPTKDVFTRIDCTTFAMPKSPSFTCPALLMRTFDGLRSRWITFFSSWMKRVPATSCAATMRIWSGERLPKSFVRSARLYAIHSMTRAMLCVSAFQKAPKCRVTCGCWIPAASTESSADTSSRCVLVVIGISFIASGSFVFACST
mmetsp:Transcript_30546/g.94345  ORF Transcript_30546/g.94345 Transcript_30546/m.94345 type:complete len:251 (-) Transcript_30546:327-1079(-)